MDPVGLSCWASMHLPSLLQKRVNWWRLLGTCCTNNTMNTYPSWPGSKIDFKKIFVQKDICGLLITSFVTLPNLIIVHLVEGKSCWPISYPTTIHNLCWGRIIYLAKDLQFLFTSTIFCESPKKITSRWPQDAPWDWNILPKNLPNKFKSFLYIVVNIPVTFGGSWVAICSTQLLSQKT